MMVAQSRLGAQLGLREICVRHGCVRARSGGPFVFPGGGQIGGTKGRKVWYAHVESFKVFADFGDELFAAIVALRKPCVWRVRLGEGEEGERRACEGEETADVLWMVKWYVTAYVC